MVIGNTVKTEIDESPTLYNYKNTMKDLIKMYDPHISDRDLNDALDYSIGKRYKEYPCRVDNSYTKKSHNHTILSMADYIASKEPIVTAHGTMFKKHADCPNPLGDVIQQFLDLRKQHKKQMFKFPKGSEDFEKYNLLQSLDKIDANGIAYMPPRVKRL